MQHITALEVPVRAHRTNQYGSLAGFTSALYCNAPDRSRAITM